MKMNLLRQHGMRSEGELCCTWAEKIYKMRNFHDRRNSSEPARLPHTPRRFRTAPYSREKYINWVTCTSSANRVCPRAVNALVGPPWSPLLDMVLVLINNKHMIDAETHFFDLLETWEDTYAETIVFDYCDRLLHGNVISGAAMNILA